MISGAYLGDKLSPLSETTVLTSQMVGVDVHEHIKRQAWTSVPAFVIAVVGFTILGIVKGTDGNIVAEDIELTALGDVYHITPLNLLPLVLLAALSIRKVPASLALMAATLFAGVLCGVPAARCRAGVRRRRRRRSSSSRSRPCGRRWPPGSRWTRASARSTGSSPAAAWPACCSTIWLIIGAVTFGAMLEEFGLIARLVDPLISAAKTTGRLFATVFACAFGLNVVAGDQYIALVLPTKVFRAEFARRDLAPTNLSRLAADSGTVTSPLVPWNSCGAFMGAVLGRVGPPVPAVRPVQHRQPRPERPVRLHRLQGRAARARRPPPHAAKEQP